MAVPIRHLTDSEENRMLSQDEMSQIIAAAPVGHKLTVEVRVDFRGGDKHDLDNYAFAFQGKGTTSDGILVCLGPPGTSIATNRYVFTFQAMKGNYLKDASYVNPDPAHGFDFVVGILDEGCGPCSITPDATEFVPPAIGMRETIVFVDRKKNSDCMLGYRFTIWATHYDGTVVAVPCDPRIINK
jgi:hypothetical protein